MTFSGWVAVLAGWYVTEIGRQPWIVQGLIRVNEVVADHPPTTVLSTLLAYAFVYGFLLFAYVGSIRYLSTKPARSLTLLHEYEANAGDDNHHSDRRNDNRNNDNTALV